MNKYLIHVSTWYNVEADNHYDAIEKAGKLLSAEIKGFYYDDYVTFDHVHYRVYFFRYIQITAQTKEAALKTVKDCIECFSDMNNDCYTLEIEGMECA